MLKLFERTLRIIIGWSCASSKNDVDVIVDAVVVGVPFQALK